MSGDRDSPRRPGAESTRGAIDAEPSPAASRSADRADAADTSKSVDAARSAAEAGSEAGVQRGGGGAADEGAPDTPAEPHPAAGKHGGGLPSLLRELTIVIVGALVVSSLLRAFVGQMFIIPSESMQNTLLVMDRVVVEKVTGYERGQIVVFTDPGGWLPAGAEPTAMGRVLEFIGVPTSQARGHLIKRVIGLPGDRVVCCDDRDRLTINGHALDEDAYLYTDSDGAQVQPSDARFDVIVPKDHVWVMGDNRDQSADSRFHLDDISLQGKGANAFVPDDLVVGPAVAIAFPFDRSQRLRIPEAFAGVPGPVAPAPDRAVINDDGEG